MSQLERRVEEKRGRGRNGREKEAQRKQGRLISFNATEPEKLAIKVLCANPLEVLYGLSRIAARGGKITLGYFENSDSFYVIVREVKEDWNTATGISAVHRDALRAMAALVYACEEKYPGFPENAVPEREVDLDW